MRVSDLRLGDVYRLKAQGEECYFAQVGEGGDVAFFVTSSAAAVCEQRPSFRVVMNLPDFKRHWVKAGNFALSEPLRELAWYGESDVGSEEKYRVRLDNIEIRTEVDATTYTTLERLAVWETSHVLQRLNSA